MNTCCKNKRRLAAAFCAAVVLGGLPSVRPAEASQETLHIVTTVYPAYDWTRQVLGEQLDHVDLINLMDNGTDLHSFQPTAADLMKIADADLFVYIGGESDAWVEDALRTTDNPDRVSLKLMDSIGGRAREEVLLPGMQEEEGHSEADGAHGTAEHEEETAYDEHIWLSLKNARLCIEALTQSLQQLDEVHAQDYADAADDYMQQLQQLDDQYAAATAAAKGDTLLFADRFPFRYMTDDYGLNCYAAFEGCSAETEASFETVAFLAETLKSLQLPCVLTLEGSDGSLAGTITAAAGMPELPVLELNSMQTLTSRDAQAHPYLSVMEENLQVLEEALQ